MRSKLFSALVAGALIASSSAAVAQAAPEPATEISLGSEGESALTGRPGATVGIAFLLIVIVIAIWQGRGGNGPVSP
jgi:hypothetical protein